MLPVFRARIDLTNSSRCGGAINDRVGVNKTRLLMSHESQNYSAN